jgi:sulfocyanin
MKVGMGLSVCTILSILALTGCTTHGPSAQQAGNAIGSAGTYAGSSNHDATNQWMNIDSAHKTVTLKLVAAMNGGRNYNGHKHGYMVIAVPTHWNVNVNFQNDSATAPHSAVVVPFLNNEDKSKLQPVFPGAASPNAGTGTPKGKVENFRFTVNKPGRYAIVCGVKGHRDRGMWATLSVSDAIPTPRIYTQFEG